MKNLIISVDCGVNTGYALWNVSTQKFEDIDTVKLHWVIIQIYALHSEEKLLGLIVEDARKRKFFRGEGDISAKAQGAGSVKREATVYFDMCEDYGIPIVLKAPRNTKMDPEYFKKLTGWTKQTSNHSRDAANMVFGISEKQFLLMAKK